MPGLDFRCRRLPGQALEDTQRRLTEISEHLLKIKGDREHQLDTSFKACYLSDPDTLIAAANCGELRYAVSESSRRFYTTADIFDGASTCFLSALEGLATALAYEEANPNIMWSALLLVNGNMAKCETYLEFLETPERPKKLPNYLDSPTQAGSKGGAKKSQNLLLIQTMLALLLYKQRPGNGWKNPTHVAKELKAPMQQFLKENKIKTLGANNKFDIEETILRWIDDEASVKLAFQMTKQDQST
ncbi:MAG: hypothetical protein KA535_06930 [Azonexus sp.]|nr:hypothetical protein [Azonexus sp.]